MRIICSLLFVLSCSCFLLNAQTRQSYDDARYDSYDDGSRHTSTIPVKVFGGLAIISYLVYRVIKYFASESKDAKEAQEKKEASM